MAKCKNCGKEYHKTNSFHVACSPKCAYKLVQKKKKQKLLNNKKLCAELKPYSWHVKKAQTACNKYIRERDKNDPCISCGRSHQGQYHAGHYLTTAARPELRFHPANIHKQCSACNNYLSGNLVEYRKNLIKKVGLEIVEYLENFSGTKFTIEELGEIERHYKELFKIEKNK